MEKTTYPTLEGLKCPKCQSAEYKVLGKGGAAAKEWGTALAFGAVGGIARNFAADAKAKEDFELHPIAYKCMGCKKNYETLPFEAMEDEILSKECTVVFHRLSAFASMAVSQQVYLNGVKVGSVKNKKALVFKTYTRNNTVFVTDQHGKALPGVFKFVAAEGGTQEIRFKNKFIR